jgi:formate hydrogenlyase subunit 4
MEELVFTISYAVTALLLPPLALGVIRKVKARLQNRIGAPIWQPLLDVVKLLRKDETLSDTASWMFRFAAVFSCAAAIYLALATPWLSPKPAGVFTLDIFMLLYLLAAMRLFTLLAAMDTGSAFGAFAASREATLSFLVEPVSMLTLVSLAIVTPSTQLDAIFAFTASNAARPALWGIAGTAILLASLVELSRMPIDDPTTHLELTMVHEAMLLEASGKNLALFEYANTLKLAVLFGLSAQCYLHAIPVALTPLSQAMASAGALFLVCLGVGVFESLSVKLNWRKAPEFIAYGITLAVVGSIMAVGSLGL